MSQITTHILDTSQGRPAKNVEVILFQLQNDWVEIGRGVTDQDGRIAGLLPEKTALKFGIYKLVFDTKSYFDAQSVQAFYPVVEITFEVSSNAHYHVPLLLNPFGYSTYRGS